MSSYLVTGASRGIGLEIVRQLAALPALDVSTIFAVTRGPSKELDHVISASPSGRVNNVIIKNLLDETEVEKAAKDVEGKLEGKGLDVLVNNAGVMPLTQGGMGKTEHAPARELIDTFAVNVGAAQTVTSGFLGLLRQGKSKKVINISTELGSIANAQKYSWAPTHAYKISKAAMNMLNQQYALDLGSDGFIFLLISPGWLKTDLGSQNADLEVTVGVGAILDIILKAGNDMNGKFVNIRVPGWENVQGPNVYNGAEIPW